MRPSPLQLQRVLYRKVSVLPTPTPEGETAVKAAGFDFDQVSIRSAIGSGARAGQEEDPKDFLVNLEIGIDNKDGKPAPYCIDIEVAGVFHVLPSLPKEKRLDLVTVNGASILYGVIREIVSLLTSRFASGTLTLPGMNFEDSLPSKQIQKQKVSLPIEKRLKLKKRASKLDQ